jgi:tRNA U34 5-methylaminomethyl-2-thiouridine-forming methyltransferase MnmC
MEQYRKPNMFYKKNGLSLFQNKQISILEIGFGTGLNAFITFGRNKMNQSIDYVGWKLIRFPRKNWFHELRRRRML